MGKRMKITNLGDVLRDLGQYSWQEWVYIDRAGVKDVGLKCLVLDPDNTELGSDDFTPEPVEHLNMVEFLSIQDLISVKEGILKKNPMADISDICNAAIFYFENDAFT